MQTSSGLAPALQLAVNEEAPLFSRLGCPLLLSESYNCCEQADTTYNPRLTCPSPWPSDRNLLWNTRNYRSKWCILFNWYKVHGGEPLWFRVLFTTNNLLTTPYFTCQTLMNLYECCSTTVPVHLKAKPHIVHHIPKAFRRKTISLSVNEG